jgi:putative hydroxymethylpyrimidine transporter CytX
MDGLNYVNTAAVLLLFVMTIIMTINIFTSNTTLTAGQNPISIGSIIELNVVMPLSWLPLAGDYTRFGKSIKGSTIGTFLGYFVGSSWMFIAGLAASLVTGDSDPTKLFTVMNLGIVALGIILLSTVTTTFMDAYSAGVSFVNITSKIKEKHAALIITVLATVLAFVFPMEQYEDFLYFIGSVFAPLFAIIFVDYFIFKKSFVDKNKKFKVDILALIVWALGVALYYGIKNMDILIGITTPVMIVTSLIYGVARKVVSEAKTNYGKYEESI